MVAAVLLKKEVAPLHSAIDIYSRHSMGLGMKREERAKCAGWGNIDNLGPVGAEAGMGYDVWGQLRIPSAIHTK